MPHIIEPGDLTLDQIEEVERLSMRYVYQAIQDFIEEAVQIFQSSPDSQKDVAEDVTREALGRLPGYPLPRRIFGTMDFKRAGYIFLPDYAVRQALLVDSKAEKSGSVARLQTSQTSLPIVYEKDDGTLVSEKGTLTTEMLLRGENYLVTTIFVHYHYEPMPAGGRRLKNIRIAACPSARLQHIYVPGAHTHIWNVGPHSPVKNEKFRVRLSFRLLRRAKRWRVQQFTFRYDPAQGTVILSAWSE